VFDKKGFQKWVRISFIANAAVTPLIMIVYFSPGYSYNLLLLGFPWAVTAPLFMLMLAMLFRKNSRKTNVMVSTNDPVKSATASVAGM